MYIYFFFIVLVDTDVGASGGHVSPPRDPWEDDITRITMEELISQQQWVLAQIRAIPPGAPSRASLDLMLEAVDSLMATHQRAGPLSDLWRSACLRRRTQVLGPDSWQAVKAATDDRDVRNTLFDIPPNRGRRQPLRLKEFKLAEAAAAVYDRFIGAWGMFPHHDQVPLYFARQLYAEFILGMHPDYTDTPSRFYGAGRGCSYDRPGARRDPTIVPPPPWLLPHPDRTIVRSEDVVESSQLGTEVRTRVADTVRTVLTSAACVATGERSRPSPPPPQPDIPFLSHEILLLSDPDSVREYAESARDAYYRMYHRYTVPVTTQVYFLFMYNIFVSFFSRIKSIKLLQFMLYIYIYIFVMCY